MLNQINPLKINKLSTNLLNTKEQLKLFRRRSIIETNWDVLKERFNLVSSFARSISGLLRHYIYSLVSFMLKNWEPKKLLQDYL